MTNLFKSNIKQLVQHAHFKFCNVLGKRQVIDDSSRKFSPMVAVVEFIVSIGELLVFFGENRVSF